MLLGSAGGRQNVCEKAASKLQRKFVRISCSVNTQIDDLFGSVAPSGLLFQFSHGALASAVREKASVVLDEINLLRMDVQTALLPLLQGKTMTISDEEFDFSEVFFVATMNPVEYGGGEESVASTLARPASESASRRA